MYYIADSHSLIWHLTEDKKLGRKALEIFTKADNGEIIIIVPTIVLAEIIHICEKKKAKLEIKEIIHKIKTSLNYIPYSLNMEVLDKTIALKDVSEIHDKIIIATATITGAILITKDKEITNSKIVKTIW